MRPLAAGHSPRGASGHPKPDQAYLPRLAVCIPGSSLDTHSDSITAHRIVYYDTRRIHSALKMTPRRKYEAAQEELTASTRQYSIETER
jgi:hypothetical protein